MIEIFKKDNLINIKSSSSSVVTLDTAKKEVRIGDYVIDFPGEYEKSGISLEVREYDRKFFYNFLIDGKVVFVLFYDDFEKKDEIMSFFGDIDILLIIGTKKSAKIIEDIEAKVIIPFGEQKDEFLNALSQHKKEVEAFKFRGITEDGTIEFVNLK